MAWPRSWVGLPQHDDRHALRVMVLQARSVAEGVQAQLTNILLHAVPHGLIDLPGVGMVRLPGYGAYGLLDRPVAAHGPLRLHPEHDRTLNRHYPGDYHPTDPAYHAIVTLWSRRQLREAVDAWHARYLAMHGRVVQETARVRRLGAQVAGDLPIHGDDGVELTGAAADAERRRLYAEDLCAAWTRLVDRDQAATWLRTATHHDLAEGAFSPDLRTAHQQIIERIDDAARERAAWLLDAEDPACARPVGSEQITAMTLLERRRQAGRRAVRATSTVTAAATAGETAIRLIEDVLVEHAPAWRTAAGGLLTLADGLLHATWTAPASGRWTLRLSVVRTDDRRTVLTPDVVLDVPDLPDGWDVTIGTRPHATPVWPVTLAAPLAPAPGAYRCVLDVRDDIGPSRLDVRIVVPDSTGDGDG